MSNLATSYSSLLTPLDNNDRNIWTIFVGQKAVVLWYREGRDTTMNCCLSYLQPVQISSSPTHSTSLWSRQDSTESDVHKLFQVSSVIIFNALQISVQNFLPFNSDVFTVSVIQIFTIQYTVSLPTFSITSSTWLFLADFLESKALRGMLKSLVRTSIFCIFHWL